MPAPVSTPKLHPAAIIDRRFVDIEGKCTLQVLVEWVGLPRKYATWVCWTELLKEFLASDLEDKVIVEGESDDMNQEWEDASSQKEAQEQRAAQEERAKNQHAVKKKECGQRIKKIPKWINDYPVEFSCNRISEHNEGAQGLEIETGKEIRGQENIA